MYTVNGYAITREDAVVIYTCHVLNRLVERGLLEHPGYDLSAEARSLIPQIEADLASGRLYYSEAEFKAAIDALRAPQNEPAP